MLTELIVAKLSHVTSKFLRNFSSCTHSKKILLNSNPAYSFLSLRSVVWSHCFTMVVLWYRKNAVSHDYNYSLFKTRKEVDVALIVITSLHTFNHEVNTRNRNRCHAHQLLYVIVRHCVKAVLHLFGIIHVNVTINNYACL